MSTIDNPSAFPYACPVDFHGAEAGMSLRDWFAGQIANGMAAHSGAAGSYFGPGDIAARSYEVADAMLAERAKGGDA